MIKSILPAIFAAFILLTGTLAGSIDFIPHADGAAMKAKGTYTNQFGSSTKNKVCGDRLCSEPREEKKKEETAKAGEENQPTTETTTEPEKQPVKETEAQPVAPVTTMEPKAERKLLSGTMASSQDPGIGHEGHQLVLILPPSDKVYDGVLTYAASEPIQLVTLHGPLAKGDEMGQATWTADGTTKYGLTFIDNNNTAGTWYFTGNALAVHTMHDSPFSVSFSLSYEESPMSDTVKTGTLHSVQDPGIGHEGHQLAIVLPPRDTPYFGTISYVASEHIQLVALHGPLKDGQDLGQPIWTPDGKTKYALTFVDPGEDAGVWKFGGNALAFHSTKTTPFTVTYSVSAE